MAGVFAGLVWLCWALLSYMPRWTRPDIYFSVTVQPEFRHTPEAKRIEQRYRRQVALHSLIGSGLVLLVDDEEAVRHVGASMLQHAGFDVITAHDGHEAVDLFRRRRNDVDCVLLDLAMPGLDGVETFRELRRIRSDVQVVLTSGYSEQEAVNRFSGKKLAGFVQKPFRLVELMDVIKRAMDG